MCADSLNRVLGAALTAAAVTVSASAGVLTVGEPPELDGRLDDACWQRAQWETGFQRFTSSKTGREPTKQTSFALCADAENLYFAFRCPHADMTWLRAQTNSLWGAEAVEFYFAPSGNTFDFYQFLITYQGTKYQSFYSESGNIRPDPYRAMWEYRVTDDDGAWYCEGRIPFSAFYMTRQAAWSENWKMNVARTYRGPNLFDANCWVDGRSYRDLKNYRAVGGFPVRRAEEDVWVKSVEAAVARPRDGKLEGTMKLVVLAGEGGEAELTTSFSKPQSITLKPGDNEIRVPAVFPENGRLATDVKIVRKGESVAIERGYPMLVDYQAIRLKLTTPVYRNNFYPGQNSDKVVGRVVTAVKGAVEVTLEGPGFGKRSVKLGEGGGEFRLDTKGFEEGTAVMTVRAGEDVKSIKVRKILKNPSGGSVSWIENGNLVVDGKAVFRRNMYADGYMGGELFAREYRAGFYDLHQTDQIKGCGTLEPNRLIKGMETKEATKDVRPCKELLAAMDKVIDATLASPDKRKVYYYISDEPECRGVSPIYLRHMYEYACDRDPYHVILCGCRGGETFIDVADWFETHPYLNAHSNEKGERIYGRHFNELGSFVDAFKPETHPDKCIGCMPTCFAYSAGSYVTFREYAAHVWNFLIHGVRTFYPYAYHDLGDTAILYRGVKFTNESVERLEKFFLFGKRTVLCADKDIEAAMWEYEGDRVVAIVNMRPMVCSVKPAELGLPGGSYVEFRGVRRFPQLPLDLEIEGTTALVLTNRKFDQALSTFAETDAEVAKLEAERLGRDNQLLGHVYDIEFSSSTKSKHCRKLTDGARNVIAWYDQWGRDKFVELGLAKLTVKCDTVAVYGMNTGNAVIAVDGRKVPSRVVEEGEFHQIHRLDRVYSPKKLRIGFPNKGRAELYEIELPAVK